MQHDVAFANNLRVLQDRFVARISDWLPGIAAVRDDLAAGLFSKQELLNVRMQAHKIAGSASTFGFPDLSRAGACLEDRILTFLNDKELALMLDSLLQGLDDFIDEAHLTVAKGRAERDRPALFTARPDVGTLEALIPERLPESAPDIDTRRAHIMIVDDDDLLRSYLVEGLADFGWTFAEAVNGRDAILQLFGSKTVAAGQRPDLIVLDVDMPELDGFSTLEMITASPVSKGVPVIMLTAKDDQLSLIRGYSKGALEYWMKPVDVRHIGRMIKDRLILDRT